ncbi:MAG TPA: DUF6484 domain-containing protein [Rhizobacter sp.]|jgi:hypothetical protein|nr:DUF6484 domain-containing protein [Rhizobacter sp.]
MEHLSTTAPTRDTFSSQEETDVLAPLLRRREARLSTPLPQVVIGELVALSNDGHAPLVTYPGQPGTAALHARSLVDLHGDHVGCPVALAFEHGDGTLPLVTGVVRTGASTPREAFGQVDVEADGERTVIIAKDQLVLRCGKASITLTKAGKVVIEGAYVSSRSTGVNRVKGTSLQLN